MGRKILAVVAALIAAVGVIVIAQLLMMLVVDPPSPVVMNDPVMLREYLAALPANAYILLAAGYAAAAVTAGYIVTKMSRRISSGIFLPLIAGLILTLIGFVNFFITAPGSPTWAILLGLVTFIPFSLLGHRLAR